MFYNFACKLVRFILFFIFRIRVVGKENVPMNQRAILAVNHRSNWDVVVAGAVCPRQLTFMAKAELFEKPFLGGLIRHLGAFPIQRGKGDIGAIKTALTVLGQERMLLMFPEGRRVKNEAESVHAKTGVAMLSHRARAQIIPTYISGKYRWMSRITVTFGKPVEFSELYGSKVDAQKLQELSDQVLEAIRSYKSELRRNGN